MINNTQFPLNISQSYFSFLTTFLFRRLHHRSNTSRLACKIRYKSSRDVNKHSNASYFASDHLRSDYSCTLSRK